MRLILESKNMITITKLPQNVTGNFWIINGQDNLLSVEFINNQWLVKSTVDIKLSKSLNVDKISNINYLDNVILEENKVYYIIDLANEEKYILYCIPSYENMENLVIDFKQTNTLSIGNGNCDININNGLFNGKVLTFEFSNNNLFLKKENTNNNLFVNGILSNNCILSNGDIIFIAGIYIYFFGSLLLISNNNDNLMFNSLKINRRIINENKVIDYSTFVDKDIKVYDKKMYFQRPPRFKRKVENKVFNIDAPTQKENQQEMPLIFTIAPMITMGMMSLVTGMTSLQKVLNGDSTLKQEFTSLLSCGCMMLSMILFPLAQKFYTKMKKKQKERKRRRKYKKYIDTKREEIFAEINYQKQVLIEDNLPIEKVRDIILSRSRNLWERKLEHDDFLNLRLGIGTKKPDMDIKYPEEHFTLEEDDLKDIIKELVNESKDLVDVPITLNLKENNKVGIIGERVNVTKFLDNLMLQILAYHGYDMLRIVVLTNNTNKVYWEKYKNLSYIWNNNKSVRYYATNKDEVNKIAGYLREEYNYRLENSRNKETVYTPYYLIISDDVNTVKNNNFIQDLLKLKSNLGYSLLMCVDKLDILPNECSMFVNVNVGNGGLFTNSMSQDGQTLFVPDLVNFSIINSITQISNIPLDINDGKFVLPTKYSFLEMYDVGNVNQLNILNRWKSNDIINSLSCPVGIDEQGELFNVDLHEKAHGPHGLVAGMTGSGKSEWIITYILSMAVSYSPEEVQFVLIDYKGGGLALTFDNPENNIKLPHVVGTITNLDVVEIKRSLASIESELKRRQSMFKQAREKLNESSMDIYKYQEYYRSGDLDEPMSHLFIISDEFAELKAQQPEFMSQLTSTARIGRSLGVHLILATQKPSGVVDAQVWSNSKFKVCLKVQDKSDSNEMLKMPDAAMLKETGRFYFQVGYNEFFAKGQSAYAGCPYYESEKKVVAVNSTVDFVNNLGGIIKRNDIEKKNTQFVHKGEELPNILNYIINTSKTQSLKIKPLWLSRIPAIIYVDKLKEKYNYKKEDYVLNPIIGEYDQPSKQMQNILTLPISKDGNTIIYGTGDSGKEDLLITMIYSLSSIHSVDEVNIYVLDFGGEVLNKINILPHVGDVILPENEEKLKNVFKLLYSNFIERKKLFSSFNGNYADYIKMSNEHVPNIICIINSFENFSELCPEESDKVLELARDANRYGIYFVITTSSVNGVRTRISQYFRNIISLQMNDITDYRSLLGNTNGVLPSKIYGRGLIKIGNVVEFQTASVFDKESFNENLKKYSVALYLKDKKAALSVPVLPDIVNFEHINTNGIKIDNIPVGLLKESLNIASIDLVENVGYIIGTKNIEKASCFIKDFVYILSKKTDENMISYVFDSTFMFDKFDYNNINYSDGNYESKLNVIDDFGKKVSDLLKENNGNLRTIKNVKNLLIVVIGLSKFISSLNSDEKKLFENILTTAKEHLKIHFIFIDTAVNLKKMEFESWYKNVVDSSNGVWIGEGFTEQSSIKYGRIPPTFSKITKYNYGFFVKNNNVELIKLFENK